MDTLQNWIPPASNLGPNRIDLRLVLSCLQCIFSQNYQPGVSLFQASFPEACSLNRQHNSESRYIV
jgi:hypothetical protein